MSHFRINYGGQTFPILILKQSPFPVCLMGLPWFGWLERWYDTNIPHKLITNEPCNISSFSSLNTVLRCSGYLDTRVSSPVQFLRLVSSASTPFPNNSAISYLKWLSCYLALQPPILTMLRLNDEELEKNCGQVSTYYLKQI